MFNKQAVLALLLANASATMLSAYERVEAPAHLIESKENVKKMAAGFIKGALDQEDFTKLEACMGDLGGFGGHIVSSLQDFEKMDIVDAIAGLKEIGFAMKNLQHSLGTCTQTAEDMAKLKVMLARFEHPKELAAQILKDVEHYNLKILQKMSAAREAYHFSKFYDAGYDMGEVVAMTTLGAEAPTQPILETETSTVVAHIMQGIIRAFGGKMSLEDILVCIGTEDKAAHMITNGVKNLSAAIKNKNMSDIVDAVISLIAGVKIAEGAIPVCTGTFPTDTWDYKGLLAATQALEDKAVYVAAKSDVFVNKISILALTKTIEFTFKHGHFLEFGENLGVLLKWTQVKSIEGDLFLY